MKSYYLSRIEVSCPTPTLSVTNLSTYIKGHICYFHQQIYLVKKNARFLQPFLVHEWLGRIRGLLLHRKVFFILHSRDSRNALFHKTNGLFFYLRSRSHRLAHEKNIAVAWMALPWNQRDVFSYSLFLSRNK